jgi:HAD superfamily hydrolase (TIGR01509 family)
MDLDRIKWLVFDLGGVLAEYVGTSRILAWMRGPVEPGELYRQWLFSPAVRAFESGKIGLNAFAEDIIRELDLDIGLDEILREFPHFVTGYFPGAEELLRALSGQYGLAMLSNTNAPQWSALCGLSGLDRLLDRIFLSFQMGLLKPDPEVYRHVVGKLGCAPEEIVFFDDNAHNVQGAKECGIRAVQVKDFGDLRDTIRRMGLMPDK